MAGRSPGDADADADAITTDVGPTPCPRPPQYSRHTSLSGDGRLLDHAVRCGRRGSGRETCARTVATICATNRTVSLYPAAASALRIRVSSIAHSPC